jgi:tRNA (adenine37-N6)-methyltransferase
LKMTIGGVLFQQLYYPDGMDESSLQGIDEFSHVHIIFYFNQVPDNEIQYGARHPRDNKQYPKVGIGMERKVKSDKRKVSAWNVK